MFSSVWLKCLLLVVTPGVESSSQPPLSSFNHLFVLHIGFKLQHQASCSGEEISPAEFWSSLSHQIFSKTTWQQDEQFVRLGTLLQLGTCFLWPLLIDPKGYKNSAMQSVVSRSLAFIAQHRKVQVNMQEFSVLFWPVPLPLKPVWALPYTTSNPSAPLIAGPWGFLRAGAARPGWCLCDDDKHLGEDKGKKLPSSLSWDLSETWTSPYRNPELSLGGESNSRHSEKALSSFPRRVPKHSTLCCLMEVEITEMLNPEVSSSCTDHHRHWLHEEQWHWFGALCCTA